MSDAGTIRLHTSEAVRFRTLSIEILALRPSAEDNALAYTWESIQKIETNCKPMAFHGTTLVLCDSSKETHLVDWKSARSAVLQRPPSSDEPEFEHNKCLQVLLTDRHVFVVRAHLIELYARPDLQPPPLDTDAITRPLSIFSFGWVDGIAIVPQLQSPDTATSSQHTSTKCIRYPPISIILRSELNDSWSLSTSSVDLFALYPNTSSVSPSGSPSFNDPSDILSDMMSGLYLEDPLSSSQEPYGSPLHITTLSHTTGTARRLLRCPAILSGRYGTALWIQPPHHRHSARDTGLVTLDVHSSDAQGLDDAHHLAGDVNPSRDSHAVRSVDPFSECLVGALFPGPLRSLHKDPIRRGKPEFLAERDGREEYGLRGICTPVVEDHLGKSASYWTSMDYAEEWGRVILGSSDGTITFIEL